MLAKRKKTLDNSLKINPEQKYKKYKNNIMKSKKEHYNNLRWTILNSIIRNGSSQCNNLKHFINNNKELSNMEKVVNKCNHFFFADFGPNLAENIPPPVK